MGLLDVKALILSIKSAEMAVILSALRADRAFPHSSIPGAHFS
jgi:hypothetical protein